MQCSGRLEAQLRQLVDLVDIIGFTTGLYYWSPRVITGLGNPPLYHWT